ncbi:MAG TPA: GHKL domain-containing protein [Lachnospiraceae bacterium]|nr:GHKL domain-containing protein [Lachnospiraceae bacterium]
MEGLLYKEPAWISHIISRNDNQLFGLYISERRVALLSDGLRKVLNTEGFLFENAPQSFIEKKIICENSINAYLTMLRDISGDAGSGYAVLKVCGEQMKHSAELLIRWGKIYDAGRNVAYVALFAEKLAKVKHVFKNEEMHKELLEMRSELARQEEYLKQSEEYQKELRRYRHDRKNNLIAVRGMLMEGDLEGAIKYLDNISTILNEISNVINTGNPGIDAILSEKIQEAKNDGIEIRQVIGLSKNVPINIKDLCLAIGSCFDNAIEACGKAKERYPHPLISFELIEKRGVITFRMANTSVTPVIIGKDGIATTKKDILNHGFGLKNVRTIVKKYNGYMEACPDEGVFHLAFSLFTDQT